MNVRLARAAAALALGCAGCGGSGGLSPVEGKVLYKGEPAAGARVYFIRSAAGGPGGPSPIGEVGPDGAFRLESGDLGDGAAPGSYSVLVEWPQGPPRTGRVVLAKAIGKAAASGGKPELKPEDRLHGRYLDPGKPRLHAEVRPGSNSLAAFELND